VRIEVSGRAPSFARSEGKQLNMLVTPNLRLTAAYASLSRRRQDVRMLVPPAMEDTFAVRLPAGFRVVSVPSPVTRTTPFGSYSVSVEQKPGEIIVNSRLFVTTTRVTPKQYREWRRFCVEADRALSQRLVIEK
jgi:hypothetical protein